MASFAIHLAVGKRYLEKIGGILDKESFYEGILAPDFAIVKDDSHYSGKNRDVTHLTSYLASKVDLNCYVSEVEIDTDYQKGVFLHLITDYVFFTNFFDSFYLEHHSYQEFYQDLYYSYDVIHNNIVKKYQIELSFFSDKVLNDIENTRKNKKLTKDIRKNILPYDKVYSFIEQVTDLSLEEYYQLIQQKKVSFDFFI